MMLSDEDIAEIECLRVVAMATIFGFLYIWDAHWCHLANRTEPSMSGGDAALCQITLTTCSKLVMHTDYLGFSLLQYSVKDYLCDSCFMNSVMCL